uniref:Uncharacterized protein n=1 Tax=Anguilla anguilla TaxID=7936 RepID=A0A0E9WEZ3_ANGAN
MILLFNFNDELCKIIYYNKVWSSAVTTTLRGGDCLRPL